MNRHRPLSLAVSAALGLMALAPVVQAQSVPRAPSAEARVDVREEVGRQVTNVQREGASERPRRGKRAAEAQEQKAPELYPEAKRKAPEATASGKTLKQLQALQELYEKQDMAGVIAKADQIAATAAAGPYEKSFAYSMAGNAAAEMDDEAKAALYFGKAIEADGLDNNNHFNTMYNLAVIQFGMEKYDEALKTLERFIAESGTRKTDQLALRAGLLSEVGRTDEAIAAYKALVAEHPDDKRILMNAVATLQGAEKFADANALLEAANKRGMLTEERELQALYVGYLNDDKFEDARRIIEEGAGKGILKEGPALAKAYSVLAQEAYYGDRVDQAIEYYRKAASMSADGEAYLNLAKLLSDKGKKAEAKAAAQKALDKGVKKPEQAKAILSR